MGQSSFQSLRETHAQLHCWFCGPPLCTFSKKDTLFVERVRICETVFDLLLQFSQIRTFGDVRISSNRLRIKFKSRISRCQYNGYPLESISNILKKIQSTPAPEFDIQKYEIGSLAGDELKKTFFAVTGDDLLAFLGEFFLVKQLNRWVVVND